MRTRAEVIEIARSQAGTLEYPAGSNEQKFGEWYGMNGQPWCAMFISWVLAKAGFKNPLYRASYTPAWVDMFKAAGRWYTKPRRGDIVFFDFPDSVHRVQHVGLVTRVNPDGSIRTVEGNTSSGPSGSQDNGGGVFRRVRSTADVVGYGRPAYLRLNVIQSAIDEARAVARRLRLRLGRLRHDRATANRKAS